MAYLVDELSYVSGMGCGRADGIVGLGVHRSLIQPADPDGLDHVWLQSIGLLQLAKIIVLKKHRQSQTGLEGYLKLMGFWNHLHAE